MGLFPQKTKNKQILSFKGKKLSQEAQILSRRSRPHAG